MNTIRAEAVCNRATKSGSHQETAAGSETTARFRMRFYVRYVVAYSRYCMGDGGVLEIVATVGHMTRGQLLTPLLEQPRASPW